MTHAATDRTPRASLSLGQVQRRRKLALLIAGVLFGLSLPFVRSIETEGESLHEALEIAGMVLIAIAIIGRSWSTLYIGGRKRHEVVAMGPYSISRNPLYVFSLVGVAGIGLQTGSLVMGVLLAAITLAIFFPVILREEAALISLFGAEYQSYRARVPRFGPRLSAWRDAETLVVHPKRLWRTSTEALLFLLAIPVCETVDMLQDGGYLTPLLHLP